MIKNGFKEHDKKMRELKNIDKMLYAYCKGAIDDTELQKQCELFHIQVELQKELDDHFYEIAKDVAKTHTGALQKGSKYAKFIEEYEKKMGKI